MYYYSYKESCQYNYIYDANLPKNLKFKTVTFFYKDKKFKKCHKDDYKITDIPIRQEGEMVLKNILDNINNRNIKYIINESNSNALNISEKEYLSLRNL
tara:strand:- start:537 stop:833 length:297 start_codon:yes stop_codon:yes gene_type:complete